GPGLTTRECTVRSRLVRRSLLEKPHVPIQSDELLHQCFCPYIATSSAHARLEHVIGGGGAGWENHSQSSRLVAASAAAALCCSKPVVRYMGTLRQRRLSQQCAQRQGRCRRA